MGLGILDDMGVMGAEVVVWGYQEEWMGGGGRARGRGGVRIVDGGGKGLGGRRD